MLIYKVCHEIHLSWRRPLPPEVKQIIKLIKPDVDPTKMIEHVRNRPLDVFRVGVACGCALKACKPPFWRQVMAVFL